VVWRGGWSEEGDFCWGGEEERVRGRRVRRVVRRRA